MLTGLGGTRSYDCESKRKEKETEKKKKGERGKTKKYIKKTAITYYKVTRAYSTKISGHDFVITELIQKRRDIKYM